jgi:hypothetical protein
MDALTIMIMTPLVRAIIAALAASGAGLAALLGTSYADPDIGCGLHPGLAVLAAFILGAVFVAAHFSDLGLPGASAAEAGPTLHLTAEEADALREHLSHTLDSLSTLDCDEEDEKRILGLLEGIRSRLT